MKALSALLCAALALAPACRERAAASEHRQALRVTTAFGPFTRPLIEDYRAAFPALDVQSVNAVDSDEVVRGIEEGRADLGLAYADAVFSAYSAKGGPRATRQVRGVALLEPLPIYFFARADSGIRRASDVRGHRVGVTVTGQLSRWTLGGLVLDALGVDANSVKSLPTREAVQTALTEGTVDAVLLAGWLQSTASAFQDLRASGVTLVAVEGASIDRLRREYPFIRSVTVPAVLYPGQEHAVVTVGMDVLVICRRDLDEAVVYDAIKEMLIVYPRLSGVEATLRFLNLDEAAATPIPLHPGAARYYRERELSR